MEQACPAVVPNDVIVLFDYPTKTDIEEPIGVLLPVAKGQIASFVVKVHFRKSNHVGYI